jgi:hypothetical protein
MMTDSSYSPGAANPFDINVNLTALLLALVLTAGTIHATRWVIPDKLYFSFSKLINVKETSPFLIGAPPGITEDEVCEELAKDKDLAGLCRPEGADEPEQTDSEKPDAQSDKSAAPSVAKPDTKNASADSETKLKRRADLKVQKAAADDGFTYSIFAYLVRLAFPFLVAIVIGRLYGVQGILPASIGAAAAALLLSWPVIVLWERVVARSFETYYSQFLMLYVLSSIAFFYVARIGAFIGVKLKERGMFQFSAAKIVEALLIACATSVAKVFVEHLILRS